MISEDSAALAVLTFDAKDAFSGIVVPNVDKTATPVEWQSLIDTFLVTGFRATAGRGMPGLYTVEYVDSSVVVTRIVGAGEPSGILDTESKFPDATYGLIAVLPSDPTGGLVATLVATESSADPSLPIPVRLGVQIDSDGKLVPESLMEDAVIVQLSRLSRGLLRRLDAHEGRT